MRSSLDRARTALPTSKDSGPQADKMVKVASGPGIYSATYSNIPVYEFQFGQDLKEHVMRRRHDNWINATHILKAAGFDKPARTRILEREVVQNETHEKVQGGYGKYQGTWIPLEQGQALAHRNGIYEKLKPIFEFKPGDESPPPAPKHTTNKPKAVRKPAVPKFHAKPVAPPRQIEQDARMYDDMSAMNEDEAPDDITVASASFYGEDDRYQHDMSQPPTGHRKRKFNDFADQIDIQEQNHLAFADELLDYFLISQADEPAIRPEPPVNFLPEFPIDNDKNTALHWACAMGDVDIMKELRRFGASTDARNVRGETPLMRAVYFTNCQDKATMPRMIQELVDTIGLVDNTNSTAIHHAAAMTTSRSKHHCARYYLDIILNKVEETLDKDEVRQLLDIQDNEGNTACHIAAKSKARKCIRALIGRGASTDIRNRQGITAEELIQDLNAVRRERNLAASSSPFAPEASGRFSVDQSSLLPEASKHHTSHHSEAATSVQSKVTPLLVEKLQHLANSFDDELNDRDKSEQEAKRILKQTQIELAQISEKLKLLKAEEEDEESQQQEEAELARARASVISLVEAQQEMYLKLGTQQHDMSDGMNGNGMHDDTLELRVELFQAYEGQKERRRQLVKEYAEALSLVGIGERIDRYRKLCAKALHMEEESVDIQLDDLLKALEEGGPSEDRGDGGAD